MTAANQSPEETVTEVTERLRVNNNRKTPSFKAFEESEDIENYSPKSVVLSLRMRKWPAPTVKDVNDDVLRRRVRNQIERIRAEDLHLGEDIGECLIVKICGVEDQDMVILTRPGSPLSGKVNSEQ